MKLNPKDVVSLARNIEIKARVRNFDVVRRRAAALSSDTPEILKQEDVFFRASCGRLKLRQLAPDKGQLIHYERPDVSGPKTSTYSISYTEKPTQLRDVLASALGETTIVKKVREIYLVGQTRIHLDVVEGLGEFMELEVVLSADEAELSGQNTAYEMMAKLGIEQSDLIECAYADMMELKTKTSDC